MAEENQPSLAGRLAGSVASGVYEGVKGAVIGGAVGAVSGVALGAITDGAVSSIDNTAFDTITSQAKELVSTLTAQAQSLGAPQEAIDQAVQLSNSIIGNTTPSVAHAVSGGFGAVAPTVGGIVGATVGAASGVINGVLDNTSRADRELAQQHLEDEAKINQLGAGFNMMAQALNNTQHALLETQQKVGVLGKFTEKVLKERANPNAAVELASKPQVGSFTTKEATRSHDGAHLGA